MEKLKKAIKGLGISTVAAVVIGSFVFVTYYRRTDPETTVVGAAALPETVSKDFTPEQLVDEFISAIDDVRASESKPVESEVEAKQGLQAAPAPRERRYTSLRVPIPAFEEKVKGVSLGMIRGWGIQARAKHFLWIDTIGASSTTANRFSLFAALKDRPDFRINHSWNIPTSGDPCSTPLSCAKQLAEAVLSEKNPRALIVANNQKEEPKALEKTVQLYTSAIVSRDLKRDDYFAWADALRGTKQYDQAIEKYKEGVKRDPQFCSAYDDIGFTYLQKYEVGMGAQNLDNAEQSYRSAVGCNPQDAIALTGLGNTLIRKWTAGGRTDEKLVNEGVSLNEQALKLDPQRAEPAVNIGYADYMRGNKQHALDYFQEISAKFPSNAALFLNFGFLLYRQYLEGANTLAEATEKTHHAWQLDNTSYGAANNLGFFYFESGDTSNAVTFWRKAYALNPDDADVLAGLAVGLYSAGERGEALRYYKEALRRDPGVRDPTSLERKHFWSKKASKAAVLVIHAAETTDGV